MEAEEPWTRCRSGDGDGTFNWATGQVFEWKRVEGKGMPSLVFKERMNLSRGGIQNSTQGNSSRKGSLAEYRGKRRERFFGILVGGYRFKKKIGRATSRRGSSVFGKYMRKTEEKESACSSRSMEASWKRQSSKRRMMIHPEGKILSRERGEQIPGGASKKFSDASR